MTEITHLTPEQVVARWNGAVTEGTLRNWRSKRTGPPFIKFGSHVRYPLDKLIEYEKSRTQVPANDNQAAGQTAA